MMNTLCYAHHVFFLEIPWPKSPSTIALGVAKKATRILGLTWGNYMVIPPSATTHLQMHVAICASGSIEGGSAKPW